jgi:hypothetical protein
VVGYAAENHAPAGAEETVLPAKLTIEQAVEEATRNNLSLLAQRVDLTIAEAGRITASLRPNPVFSFSSDHMDALGTGFSAANNGEPTEIAGRVDIPFETGHKRELRMETANIARQVAEGGHLVGYALLGVSYLHGFASHKGVNRGTLLAAIVLAGLYAVTDEFHQSFTPGRTPSAVDVSIDTVGAALGAVIWAWARSLPVV